MHFTTTHRSGFVPAPIRMTLNYLECPIHHKVRFTDGTLDVTYVVAFGFDHTLRCSQRGRTGWAGGPSHPLPPCGQLTRCFSAVAELLVYLLKPSSKVKSTTCNFTMSRTTRLNKALTAALYNKGNTMTIDTQVIKSSQVKSSSIY